MNYIKNISINEFNGAFNQKVDFLPGLNIISGVNGTGKTTVLRRIKEQIGSPQVVQVEGSVSRILAISPKRNAEKKSIQSTIQFIRQNSRTSDHVLQEAANRAMNDQTFEKYESFGDLFIYEFEERSKSGTDRVAIMSEITAEYNKVLQEVFPEYEIKTAWNKTNGSPEVMLITRYGKPLDLSYMSCGETEVLALIFNIYFNTANTDLYLIDEPEVHLNWSLEKGLFTFLDRFATDNEKQIIVTSHSRVILDQSFRDKVQFFVFKNKKVYVDKDPPKEALEEIAGETMAIISTTAPTQKTFFVEDEFHKTLVEELLNLYSKTAEVVIVKDASGMIANLYKLLKSNNELNKKWVNAYLMIDGDGKDEQYKAEPRFIHLRRFNAEAYCFEIASLAKTLNKTEQEVKTRILELIKANKHFFEGQHEMFIEKLLNKITNRDIDLEFISTFDSSELFKRLLKEYEENNHQKFIERYLKELQAMDRIESVFDKKLLEAIKA